MKNIFKIIPLFLILVGCSNNRLTEKVIGTFDNGQPSIVYYYNHEGQCVREVHYYESGMLQMEGPLENGLRSGEWISYFPDGKVQSSGFFKEGARVGKAKVYYENGHLWMDGYYNDGHKCGEWITYDEQGYEMQRVDFGPCD